MRKQVALTALAALGFGGSAFAAEPFSYNYLELAYLSTEIDDLDVEGDGYSFSGAVEINRNLFAFGALSGTDYDLDIDTSTISLGLGFNFPLNQSLDLVSGVSYERLKIDVDGLGSSSDSGYGLNAGVRGRIGSALELTGGVKYADFGNDVDDFTLVAGARYYFTPAFAAGFDVSDNDDGSSWTIALRYDLGNSY